MTHNKSKITINNGKVFVIGYDNRSFLTVVRSLGRQGLIVHAGSSCSDAPALSSKYIFKIHVLPSLYQVKKWKAKIQKILEHEKFDLVIPIDDPNILLFHKFRDDFEPYGLIYLLDDENFNVTRNKMATYILCHELGIKYPKSELLVKDHSISQISENYGFPLILKPVSSYELDYLTIKNYVKQAHNENQLSEYLNEMLQKGDVIVQEFFKGVGVGVEILAANGEILTAFQHIRIHEPLTGGGSSYRRSMPLDNDLFAASKKLVKELNYSGVAMVEFRVNSDQNKWILIEINGRFWGSLPLAVASGIDFPYYLYQMLVHGKRDFPTEYTLGMYCRNTSGDINWLVERLKHRKGSFEAFLDIYQIFISGVIRTFRFREKNDSLVFDDPLPGIIEIHTVIRTLFGSIYNKIMIYIQNLIPIRIFRRKKLLGILRSSITIVFICKGNICRSPFAEHYLKRIEPSSLQVYSCGYHPEAGRNAPFNAVIAGKNTGIDLDCHRSSIVNRELLDNADIIFVFDYENMEKIISQYPEYKSKFWYLSEISPNGMLDIPDPNGKDLSFFTDTYSQIKHYLDIVQKELHSGEKL